MPRGLGRIYVRHFWKLTHFNVNIVFLHAFGIAVLDVGDFVASGKNGQKEDKMRGLLKNSG